MPALGGQTAGSTRQTGFLSGHWSRGNRTHVGILVVELEHLPELRRVDGLHESVGGCAGGLAGERESNEESGREGGRAGGRW